jgi:hypothetical protein
LLNKTSLHLDWTCSSPDSNLVPGKERYIYGQLIAGFLVSGAPTLLASWRLTLSWDWRLNCGDWRIRNTSGVPILSHWMVSIGWCSDQPILLVQCQLININKLASREEQGPSSWGMFLWSKIKTFKIQRN